MNRVARKYFLPVLLGSVLVFAIDSNQVSASSNYHEECLATNFLIHFDDDGFWGKFRESVMKDRDKGGHNDGEHGDPARGGEAHGHGGNGPNGHGDGGAGRR